MSHKRKREVVVTSRAPGVLRTKRFTRVVVPAEHKPPPGDMRNNELLSSEGSEGTEGSEGSEALSSPSSGGWSDCLENASTAEKEESYVVKLVVNDTTNHSEKTENDTDTPS